MIALEIVFWTSIILIFYTLCIYPLSATLLAKIFFRAINKTILSPLPRVSFIISAFNEEKSIELKIRSTLELEYPSELLEVIVASAGSTDRTDEIVSSFQGKGVKLVRCEGRKGKTFTVNAAVAAARGDILIFSDATGINNKTAVHDLVENFSDPSIGCVTGRVVYHYGQDATSEGFRGYQKFAVAIRQAENHFGSQTSVSGSIHAMRRSLYVATNPAYTLDVANPLHTVVKGYRVIYEKKALSQEESRKTIRDEFRARIRIGMRTISMIPYIIHLLILNRKFAYAIQIISHKILRWLLWCLMLLSLLSSLLLANTSTIYALALALQLFFYACACVGLITKKINIRIPGLSTAAFFLVANLAMGIGAMKCLMGTRAPAWDPVR
jgi:cellulose synthase/poly-beta-1,6-N-acetylglucosamine synthase-like glycosyltransferase